MNHQTQTIKPEFEFSVDSEQFLKMNNEDRELLIESLSEKEKFENLGMFKTLPDGKVKWAR